MNEKELELILQEGEGYKIEFKETIRGIEKEIVAFTNSSGGRIFIGITDDSKIKEIKSTNEQKSQIQDIANNCRPRVKIILEEFKNILIINVREGDNKPYECSSGFYKRLGPNSQKMTRDEIIDFFKSEGKIRFDELTEPKFNYPKDFDKSNLLRFLELAELSKSIKTETVLINLDVAEKQEGKLYFNNSGVLFFAKEPQQFIPWSVFTVVLFKDRDGTHIIDRKEVKGSLFEIVEKVMDFVRMYTKVAYKFTGKPQRENIYEYPFEAIREAVINSVMHKDYFEHGHNNILKFFPERIQIENIWVKPRDFILGKTVFRRNHLIADLFSRIHFGERLGSGMQRMKDICKVENTPDPEIEFTQTHFYITFKQSREYVKMAEGEKKIEISKLNERQRMILEHIKKTGRITTKEYTEITGAIRRTAIRDLNDMVNKKILKIEGGRVGKQRHYFLM
ncbi:MAG: hypothetical protein GPJ50_14070 [Candidatus Heimdallarchaeota archaeon]|nr:hypothetical protein [Candidatus Heimdallarchaeota archaeon]